MPRIMEIYTLIMFLTRGFLDIRPKATKRPRGREKSKVRVKISTDVSMPSANFCNITDQSKGRFLRNISLKKGYLEQTTALLK